VTHRKDIKRQKKELDAWKREIDVEKTKARDAARERVLADFEKTHLGLAARPTETEITRKTSIEHGEKLCI
jgi:nitric oxide synthase-interacting protein